MKTLLVFCLLMVVSLAYKLPPPPVFIFPHPERGCRYILGNCVEQCPENTHSYATGCGEAVSQRTCEEPKTRSMGRICDLSRCDCDEPLVLDTASNKCVLESDCPNKVIVAD